MCFSRVPTARCTTGSGSDTRVDASAGSLVLDDPGGAESPYTEQPAFPAGNDGLVSSLPDYLRFARMLRAGGIDGGRRLMSADSVRLMTTNQLTPAQRAASPSADAFLGRSGWGLGVAVESSGRFGWAGYGTNFSVDPGSGRIVLLGTQRMPPSVELINEADAAYCSHER